MYNNADEFKPYVGGKSDSVFLMTEKGRLFPTNDIGYDGLFYKDGNYSYFSRIENGKVVMTYSLTHYTAMDIYNEMFLF